MAAQTLQLLVIEAKNTMQQHPSLPWKQSLASLYQRQEETLLGDHRATAETELQFPRHLGGTVALALGLHQQSTQGPLQQKWSS